MLRHLLPAGAAILALCLPSIAAAAPKDAQAKKALHDAMEVDYLNTDFDKAEQKLGTALEACGKSGCAPDIKARLYVALGSVQAGGKKQLDDAKDSFVEALKLDKAAALDPDVASTEITFAYERARAELKLSPASGTPAPAPAATAGAEGVIHTPVPAQKVSTPVPVFVELSPELGAKAKKITLSYLGTSGGDWRTLVMKKLGDKGYGIDIPCADTANAGTVRYAITVTGTEGDILAGAGSRTDPLSTEIQQGFAGEPPHWPGFAAPATCAKVEEGPKQCIDDRQCNADLVCIGGECRDKPTDKPGEYKKNWVSLSVVGDVSIVSGEQVCTRESQDTEHYACFRQDGTRYDGTPTIEGDDIGNNVNLGPALSTIRITVGYDRLVLENLSLGFRAGFALNGAPEGADFLPVHLEGRIAYWLGRRPFERRGRPYFFLSGGMAQVDTSVTVQVLENGEACGAADPDDRDSDCTRPSPGSAAEDPEPRIQDLDAYKQAGFGFAGGGVGVMIAPTKAMGINLAVRGSVTFPAVTAVISPEVGVAVGF
jgi:hypothetical protein